MKRNPAVTFQLCAVSYTESGKTWRDDSARIGAAFDMARGRANRGMTIACGVASEIMRLVEVKFTLTADLAAAVCDWARERLQADRNGSGNFHDEYATTTVYFDTSDWRVFRRIGSFGRAKYRVRRYDEQPTAYLERKLRTNARLEKRRTAVGLGELERLTGPGDAAWRGDWFHRRIAHRRLAPKFQVSYRRVAREIAAPGPTGRLTIDTNLRGGAMSELSCVQGVAGEVTAELAVLELKYAPAALPAAFKELVEKFCLTSAPFSKYRWMVARMRAADATTLGRPEYQSPAESEHQAIVIDPLVVTPQWLDVPMMNR
jgi:hypothetical protein